MRLFSGDGSAQQFEEDQQRGVNYSCICGVYVKDHQKFECCFRQEVHISTLEERRQLVTSGILWRRLKIENLQICQNKTRLTS